MTRLLSRLLGRNIGLVPPSLRRHRPVHVGGGLGADSVQCSVCGLEKCPESMPVTGCPGYRVHPEIEVLEDGTIVRP